MDDEPLHAQALDDGKHEIGRRSRRAARVVLGYHAAQHEPTIGVHVLNRCLQGASAHVVEIQVHAFRTFPVQSVYKTLLVVVIDSGVNACVLSEPAGLFVAAGACRNTTAFEAGDLARCRANAPCTAETNTVSFPVN